MFEQLLVDVNLFTDTDAVRHFDNVYPVNKGFVGFVVAERLPLRLVGVSQQNAFVRNGTKTFSTVVVTFLGSGQQWVQHFDGRLEHLDEFHDALVGPAQRAGEAVSIRIVL